MELLNSLVHWSLKNRKIVIAFSFFFILFGLDSTRKLKMDAIPDITTIQVQIITTAPSLSPLEIEQYITFAVEKSMAGIPNLEEIRSISRYGLSVVTVVFKEGTDIYLGRQLVAERLKEVQENIPQGYGIPTMGPISTGLGEIYQFSLQSEEHSLTDITTYMNWNIIPILKTVPGVVEVNSFGGETLQFQILIEWEKAQSMGISLGHIREAIEKNNASIGSGYIERNKEHFLISSSGLIKSFEDMGKIQVGQNENGFPIYLSKIARFQKGHRLKLGATSHDGKGETVGAIVLMLMHENSLQTTERIKEKLEEIKKTLPKGMRFSPYYDRSVMVKTTIQTVVLNLVEGAVLVIIILLLVLGSLRAGLIIASVIPIAMLFAIVLMRIRDEPGNLMSMGAIDFGLVVDGAVIIIENSIRRISLEIIDKGRSLTDEEKNDTIQKATIEVRKAAIFGEIIIAIVYLPILTLSGIEGKMFRPMALTVLYALLGAFICSLTFVPVMASFLLRSDLIEKEKDTRFFLFIKKYYQKFLEFSLNAGKKIIIFLILLLLFSTFLFNKLGKEFLPQLNEGSMLLEITRLPSTSLTESQAIAKRIERILLEHIPEITGAVSRTGSPDLATDPMGMERTDVYLTLIPKKDWTRSKEKIVESIEKIMEEKVPEVAFSISQPIQMRTNELIAGIRSDVGIKIFGEDLDILKELAEKIAEKIKTVNGVKDIKIEQLQGLNYIAIEPDRENLSRYNFQISEFNDFILSLSSGIPSGFIYDGRKKFEIVVLSEDKPLSANELANRMVPLSKGNYIPMNSLAKVEEKQGPVQIGHEMGYRRVIIEFNVRGRDTVSVVHEIDSLLNEKISFPEGYRVEYGGNYKNFLSARNTLLIVIPITIVLIFFILWLALNSISNAILIFLNVPFAITGGIFALYVRGMPFSISSGVGFIALFGVAVLNGLVLITFAKDLEEKMGIREAIETAALLRLRSVFTTAMVASIGFIPMAVSDGLGAEVQRPLATVIIGGILSAGLLTLVLLPGIYLSFRKLQKHER